MNSKEKHFNIKHSEEFIKFLTKDIKDMSDVEVDIMLQRYISENNLAANTVVVEELRGYVFKATEGERKLLLETIDREEKQ